MAPYLLTQPVSLYSMTVWPLSLCHLPPVFAEICIHSAPLLNSRHWGCSRNQEFMPHSQHPYFREDHLYQTEWAPPRPHLSFLWRSVRWVTSLFRPAPVLHCSASSPPPTQSPLDAPTLSPLTSPCMENVPTGSVPEPPPQPQFLSLQQDALFIRNSKLETVDPHRSEWDAGDIVKDGFSGCLGTWVRVVSTCNPHGVYTQDRSMHLRYSTATWKHLGYVWSVIQVPRPTIGSKWMNKWCGAMTWQVLEGELSRFKFEVSWVELVLVGWNSGRWIKGKLWS